MNAIPPSRYGTGPLLHAVSHSFSKQADKPMQTDSGMIIGGIFLVVVGIFWVVEQRRAVKTYNAESAQTRAENRELIELQRENNRLLALIAEKLERG